MGVQGEKSQKQTWQWRNSNFEANLIEREIIIRDRVPIEKAKDFW